MSVESFEERKHIYAEIDDERGHQKELGYTAKHDDTHKMRDWAAFIIIYLGEAMSKKTGWGVRLSIVRGFFIQVAALCVAAIESIDRKLKA